MTPPRRTEQTLSGSPSSGGSAEIAGRVRLFVLVADRPYTQATHEVIDLPTS